MHLRKTKRHCLKKTVKEFGIKHKLIKLHTPKENGRVERSHRKDQERFYYGKMFYSLEYLRNRGKDWRKEYNNFPKIQKILYKYIKKRAPILGHPLLAFILATSSTTIVSTTTE